MTVETSFSGGSGVNSERKKPGFVDSSRFEGVRADAGNMRAGFNFCGSKTSLVFVQAVASRRRYLAHQAVLLLLDASFFFLAGKDRPEVGHFPRFFAGFKPLTNRVIGEGPMTVSADAGVWLSVQAKSNAAVKPKRELSLVFIESILLAIS